MQQPQAREVQAVRTMSREDGRLIYDKIGEVYVDEKTGYQPGWSDQRVAKDLGVHVPRAWVKQVREQFFGPEGSNPEITALVADAKKHLEDAALVVTRLGREADEIKHQGELIQRRIDNLEKTVRG